MENNPTKTMSLRNAFENGQLSAAQIVRRGVPDNMRTWVPNISVRTSIHADMFDAIHSAGELVSAVRRADFGGYSYLIFANQIAGWQHRLLVQLRGPAVQGFLQAMARGAVQLVLHRQHGREAILTSIDGDLIWQLLPAELAAHSQGTDADDALLDMQAWMRALLSPEAVRVGPFPEPARVCVSAVLPEEKQEAFRQAAELVRRASDQ
jgi:hypothetical protein